MKRLERDKKNAVEFGKFVKIMRIKKDLTQGEATRLAGIDQTQWSKMETGKRFFYSPKELLNISKALEISPVELLKKAAGEDSSEDL